MKTIIPKKAETLVWWKRLLFEEELVDRSILMMSPLHLTPDTAIPVGKHRRTGFVAVNDEEFRMEVFKRLKLNPIGFPNVRIEAPASSNSRWKSDIVWGDDITDLWLARGGVEQRTAQKRDAHRLLGIAFGYKIERILEVYHDNWHLEVV